MNYCISQWERQDQSCSFFLCASSSISHPAMSGIVGGGGGGGGGKVGKRRMTAVHKPTISMKLHIGRIAENGFPSC